MKLNRTPNPLARNARNGENDNWDKIEENIKRINNTVSDLVLESGGDSNLEVVQARGGKPTLNDRLNEFSSQLNDKVDSVAFDNSTRKLTLYSSGKVVGSIDITSAENEQVIQDYIDGLISDGQIEGVSISNESIGNDQLAYKSVSNDKLQSSKVGKNLFDKNTAIKALLNRSNGSVSPNNNYYASDYIPVKPSTFYRPRYQSRIVFYNKSKEYLIGVGEENPSVELTAPTSSHQSPPNAFYAKVCFRSANPTMLNRFTFEVGEEITGFEPNVYTMDNVVTKDRDMLLAQDTTFEYNENGDLDKVIEGSKTTTFFYNDNGDLTHVIARDSKNEVEKRTDFITSNGILTSVQERFL